MGDGEKGSVVVVQTEDEIAAITMAIGATLTGTRSSTATSGTGFSLMAEGLGWAGMNEARCGSYIVFSRRALDWYAHKERRGRSPICIERGARGVSSDCSLLGRSRRSFYDAARSFNYAEQFQMPVIHIVDKSMANSNQTVLPPDPNLVRIKRGKLIECRICSRDQVPIEGYKRFAFVEDGVSPRAILGQKGFTFWNTGDEHNEFGHIEEDPDNRVKMMTKRMTKLETAAREIPDEEKVNFFPAQKRDGADVTIVELGVDKGCDFGCNGISEEGWDRSRIPADPPRKSVSHEHRQRKAVPRKAPGCN